MWILSHILFFFLLDDIVKEEFWGFTISFSIAVLKRHELFVWQVILHKVIVFILVLLVPQFLNIRGQKHPLKSSERELVTAVKLNEFVFLSIKDNHVDILFAVDGELYSFSQNSSLPFVIRQVTGWNIINSLHVLIIRIGSNKQLLSIDYLIKCNTKYANVYDHD